MDREKEYPFYPTLSEAGRQEAQKLVDAFKTKLISAANEAISDLYCDVVVYIESDSWGNFRNKIMDGFKDYNNKKHLEYDFKDIRQKIFKDFHYDIIKDLNSDLLKENESLKHELELEREWNRRK